MIKWYQGEILGCPNITNNVLIEDEYDFHMSSTRNLPEVEHCFCEHIFINLFVNSDTK